jgi:hypothetical protein
MPRAIVSKVFHTGAATSEVDTYFDKIVKYIPADVVGAWVAANGVVRAANPRPGSATLWLMFLGGLALCIVWTYVQVARTDKAAARMQTMISTGAFVIWVYALGGPFPDWLGWYKPVTASLLLIAYSVAVSFADPNPKKVG